MAQRLILRSWLSPGDIVMLTATVRDLCAAYPGEFTVDVRTPCPDLWENNPYIAPLDEGDPRVRIVDCDYPLVHRSNEAPYHVIHGYRMFLEDAMRIPIPAGPFRGDIHLSAAETSWMSQVEEVEGLGARFWIVVAGGKRDYTAKWWPFERFQEVVERTRGVVRWAQVGRVEDEHPALNGVIDLRGKTTLRELVRLVYHADGVLCPVTAVMHLAAAVPMKPGQAGLRPCVVVAGGREPAHWEAYPGHQYLHTIGALPCCEGGGCWKSRIVPLGDGSELDQSLCSDVVAGVQRCMRLITADVVAQQVLAYARRSLAHCTHAPSEFVGPGVRGAVAG